MNAQGLIFIVAGVTLFATVLLRAAHSLHNRFSTLERRLPELPFGNAIIVGIFYACLIVGVFFTATFSFAPVTSFWIIIGICALSSTVLLPLCLMMFVPFDFVEAIRLSAAFLVLVGLVAAFFKMAIEFGLPVMFPR